MDFLTQVLPQDAFEAFLHGSIFNKTVFCLGEKQGMLVKLGIGEKKFCMAMDQYVRSVKPIPLQSARSTGLSAVVLCVSDLLSKFNILYSTNQSLTLNFTSQRFFGAVLYLVKWDYLKID